MKSFQLIVSTRFLVLLGVLAVPRHSPAQANRRVPLSGLSSSAVPIFGKRDLRAD